jgi:hypothetical protein
MRTITTRSDAGPTFTGDTQHRVYRSKNSLPAGLVAMCMAAVLNEWAYAPRRIVRSK